MMIGGNDYIIKALQGVFIDPLDHWFSSKVCKGFARKSGRGIPGRYDSNEVHINSGFHGIPN
jgi:hypothetical protein